MTRNAVSFDTETHRTQPGLAAPPIVCASLAQLSGDVLRGALLDPAGARENFIGLLAEPDRIIVGGNIAYDMIVMASDAARRGVDLMPAIFGAYNGGPEFDFEGGRVFDVQIVEALHGIALGLLGKDPRTGAPIINPETKKQGRYSLAACVDFVLGRKDAKVNDRFRQSYALLEAIPQAEWPTEAREYPVDDAINTLECALAQVGQAGGWKGDPRRNLTNLAPQAYSAFAMALGAAWGFNVDPAAVDALDTRVTAERAEGVKQFIAAEFYRSHPKTGALLLTKKGAPKKNMALIKRLTATAYGCAGACEKCAGSGRISGTTKCKPCDGSGAVNGLPCGDCAGVGRVDNPKTTRGCDVCDSTGLVLESAAVPRTDGSLEEDEETGEVSGRNPGVATGRDALTESGNELLIEFAEYSESDKIPTTYIPWLREGIGPDGSARPLTLRPNVLLANGRASYGGVVQLLPRAGGVRECIIPRPGKVLCSCDFGGLELATHAQSCLWIVGWSKLADALNTGVKVHDALGAKMAGIDYAAFTARVKAGDKAAKNYRQAAKPPNFGFPGGMGAPKLVLQQRKQGPDTVGPDGRKYKGLRFCILVGGAQSCGDRKLTEWKRKPISPTCAACIEVAELIRAQWLEQWPENKPYFEYIGNLVDTVGEVRQHVSGRVRGGVMFCDAANTYFSGLASEGAKMALCRAAFEEYVVRSSPLYGCRTILFAHDELVVEMDADRAHEAAQRLSEIMVESMKVYTPDVAIEAPPALMPRWFKGADPIYHGGRLVPWTPDHDPKKCQECAK